MFPQSAKDKGVNHPKRDNCATNFEDSQKCCTTYWCLVLCCGVLIGYCIIIASSNRQWKMVRVLPDGGDSESETFKGGVLLSLMVTNRHILVK